MAIVVSGVNAIDALNVRGIQFKVNAAAPISSSATNHMVLYFLADGPYYVDDAGVHSPFGGVSSVGLTAPAQFTVTGSPITSSGTLGISWVTQSQNLVLASPNGLSGNPTFRALVADDIPNLDASKITSGTFATARIPWETPGTIGSITPNTGAFTTLTTSSTAVFGSTSVDGLVHIDGLADEVQLTVDANGTQTVNIANFRNASGTAITQVLSDGSLKVAGTVSNAAFNVNATTTNSTGSQIITIVQSSANGQVGIALTPQLSPLAGIASGYGLVNQAKLTASSSNITTFAATFLQLITNADYLGTITTATTLTIAAPSLAGSIPPVNIYGIFINSISGGSSSNYAFVTNDGLVVFNESGSATSHVRIEGDTEQNLFYSNATTQRIGLATASPSGLLHLNGREDVVQLIVEGNATQTTNLQEWQNSTPTYVAGISNLGHIGLGGTATDANNVININKTFGNLAATTRGFLSQVSSTLTGNNGNVIAGGQVTATLDQAGFNLTGGRGIRGLTTTVSATGTSGTVTGMIAHSITMNNTGAGSVTAVFGASSVINNSGAGSLGTVYGYRLESVSNTGGGTVGTIYAFYVEDQTVASNNYAIVTNAGLIVFNEGGNANSNFRVEGDNNTHLIFTDAANDRVAIAGAVPVGLLHIDGRADEVQLTVDGNATQTAAIVQIRNSAGTILSAIGPLGEMGLGQTYNANMALDIAKTYTDIPALSTGVRYITTLTLTAPNAQTFNGNSVSVTLANATFNYTGSMAGYRTSLVTSGVSGTISEVVGYGSRLTHNSGATLTNAYAIKIETPTGSGPIGSLHGLFIEDLTTGTNNYAIRTNAGLIVFNEGGDANSDVRMEGDTDQNLFFLDASSDRVGIGTASPGTRFHVVGTSPILMERNSAASNPALYQAWNPNTTDGNGASYSFLITSTGVGATSGTTLAEMNFVADIHDHVTRTGSILFNTFSNGTASVKLSILSTEFVINDPGNNYDFRIEGDTLQNLFFLDASADTVHINSATTADSAMFYVNGKISTSGEMEINGNLNHDGANIGFNGSAPVAQSTGWAVTNLTPLKTYDANAATLDNVRHVLGTLITYLLSRGDLGA